MQWPTTYPQRLGRVFAEAYRVSRPNAILAVNVGSRRVAGVYYPLAFHLVPLLEEVGWKLIQDTVWHIPNALPQPGHYMDKLFDAKHEYVLVFAKGYRYDHARMESPQGGREALVKATLFFDGGEPVGRPRGGYFEGPGRSPQGSPQYPS